MSIGDPKTLAEAKKYRYGEWAGNDKGRPYDPSRCAAEVCPNDRAPIPYQCHKKPGKGPDGLFCATHDPDAKARRRKKQEDKFEAESARREQGWTDRAVGEALRLSDPDLYRKLAGKGENNG